MNAKHPQLHIECKFYRIMQGGGTFLNNSLRNNFNGLTSHFFCIYSWYSNSQVLRPRRRICCHGYGTFRSKFRRPFQFLSQKIQSKNRSSPSRSDGKSTYCVVRCTLKIKMADHWYNVVFNNSQRNWYSTVAENSVLSESKIIWVKKIAEIHS